MTSLPPLSETVLKILKREGALTHKELVKKSKRSPRTVRYALKRLKENELIIEKMNMRDMRQIIYLDRRSCPQKTRMEESFSGSYPGLRIPTSAE
jgi:DNA-binding transcriptional ArsR family regulator|nr:winged helix-turn-helix domain-containing protein [uncultured Methanoregula sp.]